MAKESLSQLPSRLTAWLRPNCNRHPLPPALELHQDPGLGLDCGPQLREVCPVLAQRGEAFPLGRRQGVNLLSGDPSSSAAALPMTAMPVSLLQRMNGRHSLLREIHSTQ